MSVGGRGEGAEMRISTSLMAMGVLLIAACAVISGGCAAGSGDPGDTAASPPGDLQETSGGPDTRSEDVAVVDAADGATELVAPDSDPVVPYRVVALGDLHGDLVAAKAAFKLAGVIDDGDHWIGGGDIVVQTGDVLDRWHLEREVMDWMEARRVEAVAAGRGMDPEQVRPLADGRIYTARQALELGLIDRIGYDEDLLEMLRETAGVEAVEVVTHEGPTEIWDLLGLKAGNMAASLIPGSVAEQLADRVLLAPGLYYLWDPGF